MRRYLGTFFLILLAATSAQEPGSLSIHGHVYADDTGAPCDGARVTLTDFSIFRRAVGVVTTDSRGAFDFGSLAPGSYALSVENDGFLSESVIDVDPAKDIAIRLRRTGTIGGRVTEANGDVMKNALVEIVKKNYSYGDLQLLAVSGGFAWTDDRGIYQVSGLAPGRYYVRSSNPGFDTRLYPAASGLDGARVVEISAGSTRSDIDFSLRAAPRFILQGRLLDTMARGPAQAKFLRAYSADPIAGGFVDGVLHEGEFRLDGLTPGRYFLDFSWVGSTNNVTRHVVFPVDIGHTDQTGVILRATEVSVTGSLKPIGHALPRGLSVYLEPISGVIRAHVGDSVAAPNVASDGSFRIDSVPPGEYRLRVRANEPALFFAGQRSLSVDGRAPVSGLEIPLDFAAGAVTGRALDGSGRPIQRATVVLQSADADKITDDQFRHFTGVGATQYSITGVVPGDYLLFAWRGDPGLIGDPDLFVLAGKKAQRVTVQSGRTISQEAIELAGP